MEVQVNNDPQSQDNPNGQTVYAGKFNSVEDLEKAYEAAQRKITEVSQNNGDGGTEGVPNEPQGDEARRSTDGSGAQDPSQNSEGIGSYGAVVDQAVSSAGLSMEDLTSTYTSDGKLSSEQMDALEQAGFSKDLVNTYLAGLGAQVKGEETVNTELSNTVLEVVGGEKQWNAISNWASQGDPGLSEAFNSALDSKNPGLVKASAMALRASYEAVHGVEPSTSTKSLGSSGSGSTIQGFNSQFEMTQAIQDPRYSKDPSYRQEVAKRISASSGMKYSG